MADYFEIGGGPAALFFGSNRAGDAFFILIGGAGAGAAPTVSYVSPTPGSSIDPTDPIVLDVTDVDTASLPGTFLFMRAVDGSQEVAWDGAAFSSNYATSTRVAIPDGFRYTLRRAGGWPIGGITIRSNVIDDTGGFAT